MLKYANYSITFREIPDEVSLCINISGCRIRCAGCHSKYLWEDIGEKLDEYSLLDLIRKADGISCVCLMGGDHETETIYELGKVIKDFGLKAAWYSGKDIVDYKMTEVFDYIKLGRFVEELGGLDSPNTNQMLVKFEKGRIGIYSFKNRKWEYETKDKNITEGTQCKDA